MSSRLLLSLLAVAFGLVGRAAEDSAVKRGNDVLFTGGGLTHENDMKELLLFGGSGDQNYTGGVALWLSGDFVRRACVSKPLEWIDALWPRKFGKEAYAPQNMSLRFNTTVFTPDNLNTKDVVLGDRPYASLMAFAVRRVAVVPEEKFAKTTQLVVGKLGLGTAGRIQTEIHEWWQERDKKETPYSPLGWDNQISNGGEWTALYRVNWQEELERREIGGGRKRWDLVGGIEGNVGYYINGAAELRGRLGNFYSSFWSSSDGDLGSGNQLYAEKKETVKPSGCEWFFFANVRTRLVVYNVLLQGQFKDPVYRVRPERMVAEWETGFAVGGPCWRLTWTFNAGRTSEFKGMHARAHMWGGVAASFGKN